MGRLEDEESPTPPSAGADEYAAHALGEKTPSRRKSSVANTLIANPLAGMSEKALMEDVEQFAKEKDLLDALDDLKKGALVAQRKHRFETIVMLTEEEKNIIKREKENRWNQPAMMYYMTSESMHSA